MLKLKANFEADWVAHLRAQLTNTWGSEIQRIPDGDIPAYYFESLHRRLRPQPRALKFADDFQCPAAYLTAWQVLQDKVRRGEDLSPHLSIRHASLFNADGLLAEWAVHHFHLGLTPDVRSPGYVERTSPLVFALTDDLTFCAINVFSHGDWEEISIIESIHRNWPDMIAKYRMTQVTGALLTNPQRRSIRRHNANVLVSTSDGTVYGPIGGGVSCSGVKMESNIRADAWYFEIQGLHARVEKTLPELMPVLEQNGYAGEGEIEGELRITEAGYQVYYPRYKILATLLQAPPAG
jgi:hypothetical protein